MDELRPTPDRVRETLFNWLQQEIVGSVCIDLYCGTGALGFEAASRGASQVIMIDHQQALCNQIKQNITFLQAHNIQVIHADAMQWLETARQKFDLVFLDPPFYQGIHARVCAKLLERGVLNRKGKVYMESEPNVSVPEGFKVNRAKQAGKVKYMLLSQLTG